MAVSGLTFPAPAKPLAQLSLKDLATAAPGQRVAKFEALGNLEAGQVRAAVCNEIVSAGRLPGLERHKRVRDYSNRRRCAPSVEHLLADVSQQDCLCAA
jgi:hypothetical protein